MIRDAYNDAVACFVTTVARIAPEQWEEPGLGAWTIRDLVGHTSRALLTVETYLQTPAPRVTLEHPTDYFLQAQASLADPAAVAARGREAGQALGAQPARMVQEMATRVLQRLQQAEDSALVTTPVGGMRLIDYLPSRVFELVIHTLDIAAALSLDVAIPPAATSSALHLAAALAVQQPEKTAPLLLAVTGRRPLPGGFSVL